MQSADRDRCSNAVQTLAGRATRFAGVLADSDEQRGMLAGLMRWLAGQFQTQAYLLAELLGRFSGRYAPYWYLSDGGHHENTAVYEALRRRVGIVICTDCGADPKYAWQDLANLIRLSRIELGCEFKELSASSRLMPGKEGSETWKQLSRLLIQPSEVNRGKFQDSGCLRVFWVTHPPAASAGAAQGADEGTMLLVVKPRLVDGLPADLHEYASQSETFPQETTADQFFNEAQWESYRALGEAIGDRLADAILSGTTLRPDGDERARAEQALKELRARAKSHDVYARLNS